MLEVLRDVDFHRAQAIDARQMARDTNDKAMALRFKEAAIQHERQARRLSR